MRWLLVCVAGAAATGLMGGVYAWPKWAVALGGAGFGLLLAFRWVRSL